MHPMSRPANERIKLTKPKPSKSGPDLAQGVDISQIADGAMLLEHANGEAVLLARRGEELFAIGAICTHYGAPLVNGLLIGDTVRCPWHHASFSLRSGAPLRPPALAQEKPQSVLIVGGGGAGSIAAETLRREGYSGRITHVERRRLRAV